MLLPAGLAGFVFLAYSSCLRFPFIQDDWAWMARFRTEGIGAVLAYVFSLKGTFFRPLSGLYLYAMYGLFGGSPVAYHIAALLVLIASSWLVVRIVKALTGDGVIATATGFVFAAAAPVHLETLLWAVGINDLAGVLFFLLAMLLFLDGRPAWSAVAFVAGCFFKEAVLVLPFVLLGYVLIQSRRRGPERGQGLRRLAPMGVAFILLLMLKLVAGSFVNLPRSSPYAIRFAGGQMLRNLYSYTAWMVQCFDALLLGSGSTIKMVINDLILVLLVGAWLLARSGADESPADAETGRGRFSRTLAFFLIWVLVPLVPLALLVNHTYRYYAIYSLPAFIGAAFMLVRVICSSATRRRRAGRGLIVGIAAVACLLSLAQTQRVLHEGMRQVTLADGTNYLVRRAKIVEMVHDGLMKELPSPPPGATILLGDTDLGAFDGDAGPRAWYRDNTVDVYRLGDVESDERGVFVHAPPEGMSHPYERSGPAKRYFDPAKAFAFRLDETGLRPVELPFPR